MFAISGWLKTAHHEGARAYLGGGSKAWRFFALDAATGELSWYAGARGGGAVDPDPAVAAPKGRADVRGALIGHPQPLKFAIAWGAGRRDEYEAATQDEADAWIVALQVATL